MTTDDEDVGEPPRLPDDALRELAEAKVLLERRGLAMRLAEVVGRPADALVSMTGALENERVQRLAQRALRKALDAAVATLGREGRARPRRGLHTALATASGAAGGALGLPGIAAELPISTTIILRSIADIARSEGEDLASAEARLQCLTVFALGGPQVDDEVAESAYFATRAGLAAAVRSAAQHMASTGLAGRQLAPVVARLLDKIALRFGSQVSTKLAAMAVPVVGAVGGATINSLFIDHFQSIARGHFTVRRLERQYGAVAVRSAYEGLPGEA